jgi:predicted HTH domain antitoxin
MTKTITTRLEEEYVKKIDELAAQRGVDRSAFLRSLLVSALKEQMIQESVRAYSDGKITLWEAAQHCEMSLWEIVRELRQRHIHASYDVGAFEKDLTALNG